VLCAWTKLLTVCLFCLIRTEPQSALAGVDFSPVSASVTFHANISSVRHSIFIPIHRDGAMEGAESFAVLLHVVDRGLVPNNSTGGLIDRTTVTIAPSDPKTVELSMMLDVPHLDATGKTVVRQSIASTLGGPVGVEDVVILRVDPDTDDPRTVVVKFEIHVANAAHEDVVRSQLQHAVSNGSLLAAVRAAGLNTTRVDADLPEFSFLSPVVCSSEGEPAVVVVTRDKGFMHPAVVRFWYVRLGTAAPEPRRKKEEKTGGAGGGHKCDSSYVYVCATCSNRTINGSGTAAAGADYAPTNGTITFRADPTDTARNFSIPINHDGATEGREWFEVVLEVQGRGMIANTAGSRRATSRVTISPSDPALVSMQMDIALAPGTSDFGEGEQVPESGGGPLGR